MRSFHVPGRSVAYGISGAAATSQQGATLAAMQVLLNGGNAVDAALTACALQGVIEPHNTGVGGDCFALVWRADRKQVFALNGSGYAPQGLSAKVLQDAGIGEIGPDSIHSVTVPGAVDAWHQLLRDHGTISWKQMLTPAIDAAENGFVVHERAATDWAHDTRLALDPGGRAHYLPGGHAPAVGDKVKLPALGRTLRRIAEEGRDSFYSGPIARELVASLQALGGYHVEDDFAQYAGLYVEPISTRYRGFDVLQIPPNGQGITALIMLNILAGFDHAKLDPAGPDRYHLQIEASRLAYALRDTYVADPAHAEVDVAGLLSETYAQELRDQIDLRRARPIGAPPPVPRQKDTIYLTVADRFGNCCSLINSLYYGFGSGRVCEKTGVIFQNRGHCFVVQPGHPNNVAPRKRPMHTIIPGLVLKDGQPALSYGVMGGAYQPVGHVQVLQNIADFGMNVQEAIDMPRGLGIEGVFEAEQGIADACLRELEARGHVTRRIDEPWGGGQAIWFDRERSTLAAGSDPRKDGCALAY